MVLSGGSTPPQVSTTTKLLSLMNTDILKKFGLTFDELKEYSDLKKKVFKDAKKVAKCLFVVLDDKNPDHVRYEKLNRKVAKLNDYLIAHRHEL